MSVASTSSSGSRSEDALVAQVAYRVTERDRAICRSLHEHQVLTTEQLYELYFNSLYRAQERLKALYELRVLERIRPFRAKGSCPYHYLLAKLGAEIVASERGVELSALDWSRARALRLASSQQLAHLVQASGVVTTLARALRRSRNCALIEWWGQRRCTREWGELVRPDGYVRMRLPCGELGLWLEYDRGTEPYYVLQEKLDRYAELRLALDHEVYVAFVFTSDAREREAARRLRPAISVWPIYTTAQRHHREPLGPNWIEHYDEHRVSLPQLAELDRDSRAARAEA